MNARTIPAAVAALLLMTIPVLAAGTLLVPPDAAEGDRFGQAVATDGSVVLASGLAAPLTVIGAPFEEEDVTDAGAVWIELPPGNGMSHWRRLTAPDPREGENFGWSVGVSGHRIVVGGRDGRALVFAWGDMGFRYEADLVPAAVRPGAGYGQEVAIDGDTVAVTDAVRQAVYVFVRTDDGWREQGKLVPGSAAPWFGMDVDVDGDRVIVGTNASAAYVFHREGATWTREGVLTAAGVVSTDAFGTVVSISGDVAVVGAPLDDHVDQYAGSAYVFRFALGAWTEEKHLVASDAAYGSRFGNAVAVDGPLMVIGAHHAALGTVWYGGAVYEFARSDGEWKERRKVTMPTASNGDEFGYAVALSGNLAVAGAHLDNDAAGDAGTVTLWPVDKVLDPAARGFGSSIDVACDTAVVGAPLDRKALVYRRHGSAWREAATLSADLDGFGRGVAVDGDRIAVAADSAVRTFVRSGDTWTAEQEITASGVFAYGPAVALGADTLAVTASTLPFGNPVVRILRHDGTSWVLERVLSAPAGVGSVNFGIDLALRGDELLVGAATASHQGPLTGAAYLYTRTGGGWSLSETLLSPQGADSSLFGFTVSLGEDCALVGAIGHACVFRRSGGSFGPDTTFLPAAGTDPANFGRVTALSGDTAVVSRDDGSHVATVFTFDGRTWKNRGDLDAVDGTLAGKLPHPLALCGNSLLSHVQDLDVVLAFHGVGAEIPPLVLSGPEIAESTTGASLSGRFVHTGGLRPPFTFSVEGDFPVTGGIDPETGAVDGVYLSPGTYAFTVRVTDGCGAVAERTCACVVNEEPRIVTSALPAAAAGRPYDTTLDAVGGTGSRTFLLGSGSLPDGLVLDPATGRISGSPTVDGAFSASFVVEDAAGVESESVDLGLEVVPVADLSGRRLREDVELSTGRRVRALELVRGTLLTVKVKFPRGQPDAAALRLLDPRGTTVDPGDAVRAKARGITLKKFEIPTCGRWFLVLEPAAGLEGPVRLQVKVKPPKKEKVVLSLEPGMSTTMIVGVLPGATANIQLHAGSWSAAMPELVSVTDEAGCDLLAGGEVSVRGKRVSLKLADTGAAGRLTVVFRNSASLAGVITAKVRVRQPKAYGYARTDEPCGLMR